MVISRVYTVYWDTDQFIFGREGASFQLIKQQYD